MRLAVITIVGFVTLATLAACQPRHRKPRNVPTGDEWLVPAPSGAPPATRPDGGAPPVPGAQPGDIHI
jgi:hypothetical protein